MQFLSTGGHNVNNISSFCDFGISSTFDAVLRYWPILFAVLRYLSIFSAKLRCSAPPNVPLLIHTCNAQLAVHMITFFKRIPLRFEPQIHNLYHAIYLEWDGITTTVVNAYLMSVWPSG